MSTWKVHGRFEGPIIMVGYGSIGRGTLPLILRHIACKPSQITVIDPSDVNRALAESYQVKFEKLGLSKANYKKEMARLLAGHGQAMIVNLSVDVESAAMMKVARDHGALYIDTVAEPWPGFYYNTKIKNADRTNYALREGVLALKRKLGKGPTAVSCCGANPGMVSWFVKQALLNLASDQKLKANPQSREDWGRLAQKLGVKGIHIAERDTQVSARPKPLGTFVNTWSVDGFLSEGKQPAELGWGTHEKKLPKLGHQHAKGCKAAIWLESPGANTRVRSWVPHVGAQYGFLVTHNESISIADFLTVRKGTKVLYRPTCHYAYHPCNDAVLSLHELFGNGGKHPESQHILTPEEITDGADLLGVLLYGHKKNAYWFGSELTMAQARDLAPHQSATGLQVTSAVLAGLIWAIENPNEGIVEADETDFRRCLEVQLPYLGPVNGYYTDWNPLKSQDPHFGKPADVKDPWQFSNILVG